nr:MAG TPA: hypothetical protein [Caudoviricetes sp.]
MPDDNGIEKALLLSFKPQIDANYRKYENGKKGGRPSDNNESKQKPCDNQTITKQKPNNNQTITKQKPNGENTKPNVNVNVNVNDNVNDNEKENNTKEKRDKPADLDQDKKQSGALNKAFIIPSLAEVKEYCQERQNTVDPEKFIDFYSAKGWMIGKNKMKDWKAAVRNWEKQDSQSNPAKPPNKFLNYNQRVYDFDKLQMLEQQRLNRGVNV